MGNVKTGEDAFPRVVESLRNIKPLLARGVSIAKKESQEAIAQGDHKKAIADMNESSKNPFEALLNVNIILRNSG